MKQLWHKDRRRLTESDYWCTFQVRIKRCFMYFQENIFYTLTRKRGDVTGMSWNEKKIRGLSVALIIASYNGILNWGSHYRWRSWVQVIEPMIMLKLIKQKISLSSSPRKIRSILVVRWNFEEKYKWKQGKHLVCFLQRRITFFDQRYYWSYYLFIKSMELMAYLMNIYKKTMFLSEDPIGRMD